MTADTTPDQYKDKKAEFCGNFFFVDNRVLIPRIESEEMVTVALNHLENQSISHPVIADIGTGSGCLGISLAYFLQKKQQPYTIFLSDISIEALQVARQNVENILENPSNIFFEQSDLLLHLPQTKFDIILANLPYIPSKNINHLDPSVKDHEPHLALDGGPDGASLINKLLTQLPLYLSPKGTAILEFDDTHTADNFHIPKSLSWKIRKDCFGKDRFLLASLR